MGLKFRLGRRKGLQEQQATSFYYARDADDTLGLDSANSHGSGMNGDGASTDGAAQPENEFERTTVRIDGLEVYAVVSALTSATSIQCFDAFTPESLMDLWKEEKYVDLVGDLLFFFASSTGIVAGLHATLVFSLMTMYSRTAVGMNRDDALDVFFQKTGLQRYRGFQTFLHSMYAFLVQVIFIVTNKSPPELRVGAFFVTVVAVFWVYRDTKKVITAASIIYSPPAKTSNTKKPTRGQMAGRRTSSILRPAVGWNEEEEEQ